MLFNMVYKHTWEVFKWTLKEVLLCGVLFSLCPKLFYYMYIYYVIYFLIKIHKRNVKKFKTQKGY